MTGPEVTVLAFCRRRAPCAHALQLRTTSGLMTATKGPNTGGMGAISPSPNYTPEIAQRCMEEIFLPTMAALQAEGRPFQGVSTSA